MEADYTKMAKKSKIKTPDWILKGDEEETPKKKKGKTFKLRRCPKCDSDEIKIVITGEEGTSSREWECKKCGWKGTKAKEDELTEDEFMKYLDDKGEEVA